MFGCVLENTIDNTFSTCCSHFLTFSRLPNEYIISFIPQNTNKTQKKSSNPNKRRRDCERRDHDRRDRSFAQSRSTRSRDAPIAINAFAVLVMSAPRRPRCRWCQRTARCRWCRDLFFLSPSLSLFYFPRPEVIWSENGNGNDFPLFWLSFSVNWKCFSVWPNLK